MRSEWLKCSHWLTGTLAGGRCQDSALVMIYGPGDSKPVPGGWLCLAHALPIVFEYRDKLGEEWPLRSLDGAGGRRWADKTADDMTPRQRELRPSAQRTTLAELGMVP